MAYTTSYDINGLQKCSSSNNCTQPTNTESYSGPGVNVYQQTPYYAPQCPSINYYSTPSCSQTACAPSYRRVRYINNTYTKDCCNPIYKYRNVIDKQKQMTNKSIDRLNYIRNRHLIYNGQPVAKTSVYPQQYQTYHTVCQFVAT